MEKLLIVDGSNLLFQMFYGMPARIINHQGKPIQGTMGFVGALLKILRMVKPTHVTVLFDGECANPRRELDENYKADRPDYSQMPEEDTPFSQLPDIFAALDHLGIRYQETTSCEADDWIAGFAKTYGDTTDVVIVSQDSDFYQLITSRVHILRYRGKQTTLWTPEVLQEKLGIAPGQYAAFKALTGDPADNIRGAEKIGPKTAAALLNQFGDLESLLAQGAQIQKPSIRESVLRNSQRIRQNFQLIHLEGTVDLPFALEELAFQDSGASTREILNSLGLFP